MSTVNKKIVHKQLLFELESWNRCLDYMQSEIVMLKNRMVHILKDLSEKKILALLEHYQNNFIEIDNSIILFRHDIAVQTMLLRKNHEIEMEILLEKMGRQKKLRKEIRMAENLFIKLSESFNRSFTDKLVS